MLWIFVLLAASLIANERGTLLNNKAALHLHRAEYAEAEELFNAAIREFEATPDGSGDAATAMSNLGEVYRLMGRFREAEAIYKRALHSREQRLGAEDPLIANILNAMSCLNIDLGDPEAAEKVASRAVAIRERAGLTKDGQFAAMLHNLGEANRRLKRFDVAEGLFQRSLRIRQDIGGTESSDYASSLHHLGAVRQDEGRLEEGFELYSRALQIRRKLFGDLHPVLGPTLNNLALICLKRGDLASAKSYSEQAVALWKG